MDQEVLEARCLELESLLADERAEKDALESRCWELRMRLAEMTGFAGILYAELLATESHEPGAVFSLGHYVKRADELGVLPDDVGDKYRELRERFLGWHTGAEGAEKGEDD